jgi:hypothetical protein
MVGAYNYQNTLTKKKKVYDIFHTMFFLMRKRKDNVVAMKESIGRRLIAAGMSFIVSAYAFGAYVTDGLVLHYDAIDNAGVGVHSDSPTVWKDLSGNGHDLTLPTSGLTVGADEMTFDNAVGEVSDVECLAEDSDTTDFTLEVVFAASGSFDGALNSARSVAANPRISLYLRSVGSTGLVGGYYYNGGKRYFAGVPTRCCEWNNTQFIRRFHTYSLRTKAGGGSVAVDDLLAVHQLQHGNAQSPCQRLKQGDVRQPFSGFPFGNGLAADTHFLCQLGLGHVPHFPDLPDGCACYVSVHRFHVLSEKSISQMRQGSNLRCVEPPLRRRKR